VGDYSSVIISGFFGVVATGVGAAVTAYFVRRFAGRTGATVQTAEQIEAARLVADAKAEAALLTSVAATAAQKKVDDAVVAAAKVINEANARAERTELEQRQWHEEQVRTMQEELARLRQQIPGGTQ
jgi:ketopantoate hydroxymethyltransferase